jgi:hypothetical protein
MPYGEKMGLIPRVKWADEALNKFQKWLLPRTISPLSKHVMRTPHGVMVMDQSGKGGVGRRHAFEVYRANDEVTGQIPSVFVEPGYVISWGTGTGAFDGVPIQFVPQIDGSFLNAATRPSFPLVSGSGQLLYFEFVLTTTTSGYELTDSNTDTSDPTRARHAVQEINILLADDGALPNAISRDTTPAVGFTDTYMPLAYFEYDLDDDTFTVTDQRQFGTLSYFVADQFYDGNNPPE